MKHVTIVEDDINIIDAVTIMLETVGYSVTIFPHADPILSREFVVPDIFIIDKQLPGVDGLDICKFLKSDESFKHIPVIMMSASPDIFRSAAAAGANAALEKPFKMKELREIVQSHL